MKKRIVALVLGFVLFLAGCSGKEETKPPPMIEQEDIGEDLPEEQPPMQEEEQAINPLSGLPMDKALLNRRPVAVMINNLPKALPQSGISQAEIIYEVLAEGGITRLEAIFLEFDASKIGPIRSTREYFVTIAQEYDAVFVHHGGSPTGYAAIKERGVDAIDGMVDAAFFRDAERLKKAGMYEHSSYSNAENILDSWDTRGYRKEFENALSLGFSFCDVDTPLLEGEAAAHLLLPYSYYQEGEFFYDESRRVYERFENGKAQIDELTGETLTAKNIIVQYANRYVVDDVGRLAVNLVGTGEGLYLTDGLATPIVWSKETIDTETVWSYESGGRLQLNPGNTWICILPLECTAVIEGKE